MLELLQGSIQVTRQNLWRNFLFPLLAVASALGMAFIGALFTSSGIGEVNQFVETLSGTSGSKLGNVADLFPLGFAFAAGMVSTVNPCGFAMLPAYLGLYLGSGGPDAARVSVSRSLMRALTVGGVVTAGFTLLFGLMGLIIEVGSRSIVDAFPWIGFSVGVLLILAAAWLIRGGTLYSRLGERAAARIGNPNQVGIRGYFLFGVSYGIASLSCTLPIFLVVVSSTVVASGAVAALGQFIVYAFGMGVVIMAVTLAMALFKGSMVGVPKKVLPYIQPVSIGFMLIAGTYIVYYWLTIGELFNRTL